MPKSQVEKPLRGLIFWLILVISISLAFAVMVSMYFGKRTGDPILSFIQKTIVKVRKVFEKLSYTANQVLKFVDEDVNAQFVNFQDMGNHIVIQIAQAKCPMK